MLIRNEENSDVNHNPLGKNLFALTIVFREKGNYNFPPKRSSRQDKNEFSPTHRDFLVFLFRPLFSPYLFFLAVLSMSFSSELSKTPANALINSTKAKVHNEPTDIRLHRRFFFVLQVLFFLGKAY